jgi:ribonuclease E
LLDIEPLMPRQPQDAPGFAPAASAATDEADAAQPEPPRRRSTVRERAPVFGDQGVAPAPLPVEPVPLPQPAVTAVPSGAAEDENQPRRTGWWARRMAGKG